MKTKFKTAYGNNPRVQTQIKSNSMTHQSFKDECDLNVILQNYKKNGILTHVNHQRGNYENLSQIDYHAALCQLNEARESFDTLPAEIREDFNNDPGQFIEFVSNPENENKMREYGFFKEPTEPISVEIAGGLPPAVETETPEA